MSIDTSTRHDLPPDLNVPEVQPLERLPRADDGNHYILVTQALTQDHMVGHVRRISSVRESREEGSWYVDMLGNWYRGIPLNGPAQDGDEAIIFDIPGVGADWARGTVVNAGAPNRVSIGNYIRSDRREVREPGHMYSHHWVVLRAASETVEEGAAEEEPPATWRTRTWDTSQIVTWYNYPLNHFREVNGERLMLVTDSRREADLGTIVPVRDQRGARYRSTAGDYISGSPINPRLEQGEWALLLDSDREEDTGKVVQSVSDILPHTRFVYRAENGANYGADYWVQAHPPQRDLVFAPDENDTEEVRALKAQARERNERWVKGVKGLLREAADRDWTMTLSRFVEEDFTEFPLVERKVWQQVTAQIAAHTYTHATAEEREMAGRHLYNGVDSVPRDVRRLISFEESFEMPTTNTDELPTHERVNDVVRGKHGYSTSVLSFNTHVITSFKA